MPPPSRLVCAPFLLALACHPAFGDNLAAFSIWGESIPLSQATGRLFSGTASCSNTAPGAAGCNANSTFYATDGSGASATLTVSGYAEASAGHLGFAGDWNTAYHAGAWAAILGGLESRVTSSASYSDYLSFGGEQPSFIELTFDESGLVPGGIGELGMPRYSVEAGNDPPWTIVYPPGTGFATLTQIFPVDPDSGGVLLTVDGSFNGSNPLDEFTGSGNYQVSFDLERVVLLDENGNQLPEPSSLVLLATAAGLIVWRAGKRQVSRHHPSLTPPPQLY